MAEKESMEKKLHEWLETQGYPLEMEAAKEFKAKGFRVGQGGYYEDPDTKKPREIDVVASQGRLHQELHVWLTCFVECKVSRDKPWVLFTSQRSGDDSRSDHYNTVASKLGMQLLLSLHREEHSPLPLALRPRERLGYGITLGLRNPKNKEDNADVAYSAVMSAAKAAVSRATRVRSNFESQDGEPIVDVIVPTVLIDGMLFEYFLDEEGTKQLRRIHWGVLSLGNPIPSRDQPTLVQVVTKEGLPEFVSSMSQVMDHLYDGSKQYYEQLMARWERHLKAKQTAQQ